MDEKFWIYIIAFIIYLISRALKKKPGDQVPAPKKSNRPGRTQEEGKSMTFEELLQEITQSKKEQQKPTYDKKTEVLQPRVAEKKQESLPKPTYVDYDDDIPDEIQDLEDVSYDYRNEDNVYEVYERAKKEAFDGSPEVESDNLHKSGITFGKFKEFDSGHKSTFLDEYAKELKDPKGFKKAFIMSEILNRKF